MGVLPVNLLSLTFGHWFNQRLNVGVLPDSVQFLAFGHKFNQLLVEDILPGSMLEIRLPIAYTHAVHCAPHVNIPRGPNSTWPVSVQQYR